MSQLNLAIWGSGSGSNAQAIIDYFSGSEIVKIVLVVSDVSDSYILERARQTGIPVQYLDATERRNPDFLIGLMNSYQVQMIALAGYMRMVSPRFLALFSGPVLNIHPSLLPAYGGKGMYGNRVHQAILENKETETGITIHLVNEQYDEGEILFQQKVLISPNWSVDELAQAVLKQEHFWYPRIIEKIAKKLPDSL
jgi:phosphoribosylglycinamide formyltransferase-1